jgi:hypothetical protein
MLNLLRRFVGNTPAVPAVLVGLGVGMAVNMGLIQLNSTVLYPAPEGMDMNDPELSTAAAIMPAALTTFDPMNSTPKPRPQEDAPCPAP